MLLAFQDKVMLVGQENQALNMALAAVVEQEPLD
jgi:hypothetical protein